MSDSPLSIGISTCPNDTFAFAALIERRVEGPELEFRLEDIEALNDAVLAGELDVAKLSFHAALQVARDYCVLPVGAALGFGVGPLLLAAPGIGRKPRPGDRVLCPGTWTTAHLLYRLYCPGAPDARQVVFSEIMPALASGEADFGVVIHEGRFTYRQSGLVRIVDLGAQWEADTGLPLPLGGIVARRELGRERIEAVAGAIRRSLAAATAQPESALDLMRRYAQELSDEVLWQHVELYVNDATSDLGEIGRAALRALEARAYRAGLVAERVSLTYGF